MLEDQLGSWAMYIPGVGNSKDAEGLKELKGINEMHSAKKFACTAALRC